MTNYLLLAIILLPCVLHSQAEQKENYKQRVYKIWVDTGRTTSRKFLAGFSDSAVLISDKPVIYNPFLYERGAMAGVNYDRINKIIIKRTGRVGRGVLIGTLAGAVTGAVIGFASGDDKDNGLGFCIFCLTAGEKAEGGAVVLGVLGAGVGAAAGALSQKKFIINGSKTAFDELKASMENIVAAYVLQK